MDADKKLRNTIQRDAVNQAVCELNHPTADEVYEKIHKKFPAISRGTVYRNLNILCDLEKLRRLNISTGADHFDADTSNHYHIQCRSCERIADVFAPYFEGLETQVADTHGYALDGHSIVFTGLCPECQNKEKHNGKS